jgi:alpha-1,2-mannosyltransferase
MRDVRSTLGLARALVIASVLVAAAAIAFSGRVQQKMRDFEVYWTAGQRAAAGEPLYRASDGHYRFKYLPAFAAALSPLGGLPLATAKAVWFTLSVACLVGFVALSVTAVPSPPMPIHWLTTLTVVAMAKFYAHELVLGQANLMFGLLCAAALAALLKRRRLVAGFTFGAAALVNPYAFVFVPYLLLTSQWGAALAASAALLVVTLLPIPVFGLAATRELMAAWWRTATETSAPLLTNADSSSVFAMYAKWWGWGSSAAALSLLTIGVLGCAFLLVLVRRDAARAPEILEVGLLLTFIPLCTPQGWDYVLLLSTPLIALLIARTPDMPRVDRWATVAMLALVAFSLYDVLGRAVYAAFMSLSIITLCYLALTGIAVRLRLRGAA